MVSNVNQILNDRGSNQTHTTFIISGGIRSFLEGHFLVENCEGQACYGMAKPFLEAASGGDEKVRRFVTRELEGLTMARAFLKAKALNQLRHYYKRFNNYVLAFYSFTRTQRLFHDGWA